MSKPNFSYITNNCITVFVYKRLKKPYDNPFVGSLFQNDEQFLKFCRQYNYYIKQIPRFSKPLQATFKHHRIRNYPVMFLDDIEIHWIHEKSPTKLIDKYKRRLIRNKGLLPFFFWSDSQLYQFHPPEERERIIASFLEIPHSVYFRMEEIPKWKRLSMHNREDLGGIQRLRWGRNYQKFVANLMLKKISVL